MNVRQRAPIDARPRAFSRRGIQSRQWQGHTKLLETSDDDDDDDDDNVDVWLEVEVTVLWAVSVS